MTERTIPSRKGGWGVSVALVALCALPLIMGTLRLVTLAGLAEIMPDGARFAAAPLPVVVHIVSAAAFALLGAFQFAAGFRRRRPGWHRAAGRVVVAGGLLAGLAGLWMTLLYPRGPNVGALLTAFRLLFGSAMVAALVLGFGAIRRGDVRRHRAWMTRAYAIGLGAGTQVFTGLVASVLVSPPTELSRALQDGAGWAINLAVAEWLIRRSPARPARPASAAREPVAPIPAALDGTGAARRSAADPRPRPPRTTKHSGAGHRGYP
jgi:uncharacterized membrane protein